MNLNIFVYSSSKTFLFIDKNGFLDRLAALKDKATLLGSQDIEKAHKRALTLNQELDKLLKKKRELKIDEIKSTQVRNAFKFITYIEAIINFLNLKK